MGLLDGAASGASSGGLTGPWGAVIGAGIGATAGLIGGKQSSDAQERAAKVQADAIAQASQIQKQSADATLAFEKDQAAQSRADNITAQNANFGQWGYRQNTIRPYQGSGLAANNTLAQMLGLPAQNQTLPDLPPAPVFTTTGAAGTATAPSATATVPTSAAPSSVGDPVTQQLLSNYKALGVAPTGPGSGPTDIAYYAQKINETGGATPQNLSYWLGPNGRIATDLAKARGGAPAPAQTIGGYAGLPPVAPTPAGTGNTLPFIPMTIGSYAANG